MCLTLRRIILQIRIKLLLQMACRADWVELIEQRVEHDKTCGLSDLYVGAGGVTAGAFVGAFVAVHGVHMHAVIGVVVVDVR